MIVTNDPAPEILQHMCDTIANEIQAIVSIMGEGGLIIASSARERIGDVHEGAARIMSGEVDEYTVTAEEAARSSGMREGYNLAIDFRGQRLWSFAVATSIEKARPFGRLAREWVISHLNAQREEELRALGDIIQAVNSTLDLETVLTTIVAKAVQLSKTEAGTIYAFDDASQEFRLRATYGMDDAIIAAIRDRHIHLGETAIGRAVEQRMPIQVPDIQSDPSAVLDVIARAGFRALLTVPLLATDRIVGALVVRRKEPGEFAKNTIELLQTFAAQSVLAIQNARLFHEIEEKGRQLAEASQNITDAIETISEGFSLYNAEDRLVVCNSRYCELFSSHADVMVPGTPFEAILRAATERGLILDAEGDRDAWIKERVARHRKGGQTHVQRRSDGRWIQVSERKTANGGIVAIYADITELKKHEAELAAARDAADEANRTKSSFLASMSHELRTPLNAIIGYSEILQEDAADKGDKASIEDLQKIETSGRHLLGLINNILDLSKIEAGKLDVFIEEIDIQALVTEVLSIVKPLADKNENAIEVICPADIGSFRSDQTKVKQCLLNLMSNGNKFTTKGALTLTVAREGGSQVCFRVSDTGIGMTKEQLGRLFQAFSQADASTTKRFGGTGLGLAITKHFCTILGGGVTVESAPGTGSTFTIRFPDQGVAPASVESPVPVAAAADARATVLVVDDDPTVRSLLAKTLEKEGYRVIFARNGVEALTLAREHKPQAITLDVLMPQMDGWGALKELKADAKLRDIPVIMVTVLNERGMAIPLGAADFMTKPVDRQRLTAILRDQCAGPSSGSILVVEDDLPTREMLCRSLASMGYMAHVAVHGRDGLDWLAEHPVPSLILLDLMMPEMDGFEFLRELRKRPAFVDVPVIVVTAKELTAEDVRILSGQTERIITKDQSYLTELAAAVRGYLARQPAREAERVAN